MADAAFSLGRRLVWRMAGAVALVLAANVPFFVWRGSLKYDGADDAGFDRLAEWLIHELVTDVIPLTVPTIIAILVVAVVTVRQAMKPIADLAAQAAGVDPARLDVRLSIAKVPDEVRPLVEAINSGLDRLAEGFASQRRFTASAAHELRTPLAILKARCSDHDCPVTPMLAADIDRMARVMDQLLAMARLEMRQIPLDRPVDLNAVGRGVVADLYPLALARRVDLGFAADGAWALPAGNAEILTDALRNLVENALRLSPDGSAIDVEIGPPGVVRVADRGPGVPDSLKRAIFQPFARGEGSRGGGAGLGLAIAAEAVGLHGGTIAVADRPGGGAIFVIDLSSVATASG